MSGMEKSVGIVSNVRVTYSAVAANYANVSNRAWEAPNDIPPDCEQKAISDQLVTSLDNGNIDIVLGGGTKVFFPANSTSKDRRGDNWMQAFRTSQNSNISPVKKLSDLSATEEDARNTDSGLSDSALQF